MYHDLLLHVKHLHLDQPQIFLGASLCLKVEVVCVNVAHHLHGLELRMSFKRRVTCIAVDNVGDAPVLHLL
jgi:hypothetical protein